MAGDEADCLNSCRESATLRPMPALLCEGERCCWVGEVSEDESEEDESTDALELRRDRLLGEDTVGNADDEGSVSARTGRKREERLRVRDGSASTQFGGSLRRKYYKQTKVLTGRRRRCAARRIENDVFKVCGGNRAVRPLVVHGRREQRRGANGFSARANVAANL